MWWLKGRCGYRPSWWTTGCSTCTSSNAGLPARATRWPTGCAHAGTSRCFSRQRKMPNAAGGWTSRPPRTDTMQIHKEIDTRGLNCPLPILKAKKALADMQSGELLKVLATDGGSLRDFQAFAKQTGNELVEQQTVGEEYIHVLRRR